MRPAGARRLATLRRAGGGLSDGDGRPAGCVPRSDIGPPCKPPFRALSPEKVQVVCPAQDLGGMRAAQRPVNSSPSIRRAAQTLPRIACAPFRFPRCPIEACDLLRHPDEFVVPEEAIMDAGVAVARREADPQIMKRWAAEDYAIAVGLLRECPYHGEPYKPGNKALVRKALAARRLDPYDPIVRVFNGNTHELMAAVEQVTGGYGECCPYCRASDEEVFD